MTFTVVFFFNFHDNVLLGSNNTEHALALSGVSQWTYVRRNLMNLVSIIDFFAFPSEKISVKRFESLKIFRNVRL